LVYRKSKPCGCKPLLPEPRRICIEHDLPEAERSCPCGYQRTLIDEETSEQLDIIPAQVLVHVRKKYVCQTCETLIHHEPDDTKYQRGCPLKRVSGDISEKLDYVPDEFTVEMHIRGNWFYDDCQTLVQALVLPHVIDKGIPTTGLMAQALVAKYADHLPLYRQDRIFGRAGLPLPCSTLGVITGRLQ